MNKETLMALVVICLPILMVGLHFTSGGCGGVCSWETPRVGKPYIHSPNEDVVEETETFVKYRIRLERREGNTVRDPALFITVKNDTIVSIWRGQRGY